MGMSSGTDQTTQVTSHHFQGFSPDTIKFLRALRENNSKMWFDDHRQQYQDLLLRPFQQLVLDLSPHVLEIDPAIEVFPFKKVLSRINRDIRFSPDKSPYRPNMWLIFKRPTKDWKADPVYWFELMPETYRYGMGFYSPSKATMGALRRRIDEYPEDVEKFGILFAPHSHFELCGAQYKRPVKSGTPTPPALVTWYQRKEIYVMYSHPHAPILFHSDLVEELRKAFVFLRPLYKFFWELRNASEESSSLID